MIASTTRDLERGDQSRPVPRGPVLPLERRAAEGSALRERRADIPLLARHFMVQAAESSRQRPREISEDAIAALQTYDWPGNVRELRNIIERLLIMAPGGVGRSDPRRYVAGGVRRQVRRVQAIRAFQRDHGVAAQKRAGIFEREYLLAQVSRFGGNISRPPRSSAWSAPRCTAS